VLDDVELPDQAIAASWASGVPALGEANPDLLKDQPLLGFSGLASEVQDKKSGPVGLHRAQVEVNPVLGDNAPSTTPLKRSTGPGEAEDFPPPPIQQVEAVGLFDQRARLMPTPSSAASTSHELSPSGRPKSSLIQPYSSGGLVIAPPSNFHPSNVPAGIIGDPGW
jgi:hypothetical protein